MEARLNYIYNVCNNLFPSNSVFSDCIISTYSHQKVSPEYFLNGDRHYLSVIYFDIKSIFSMFDISIITCTPFIGKVGIKYDKRTLIAGGYLICVISSTAFALLDNDYDR